MQNQGFELVVTGNKIIMHPMRALFLDEYACLLIADLHLGKLTHFRKEGIALPTTHEKTNLERLTHLVEYFNPERVVLLGDLFHSDWNTAWYGFQSFTKSYESVEFSLVKGNHDILPYYRYRLANLHMYDELTIGNLFMTHHPTEPKAGTVNVCGHIHPGVKLKGSGRQSLHLPCFYLSPNRWILPAFGMFTGNHPVKPTRKDSVFVIADDEVLPVH